MAIPEEISWLTVPDVAERLNTIPGKVRRLIEERALLGKKIEGVFRIPEPFLPEGEPLKDLGGTVVVLLDGGFSEDEAVEWLLTHHEGLGVTPVEAIRWGRKTEVRRVAQVLAL